MLLVFILLTYLFSFQILGGGGGCYGWTQTSAVSFLSRGNRLVLPGETFAAIANNQNEHFQAAAV